MKFSFSVSPEMAVMASGALWRLSFSFWPTTTMGASSSDESAATAATAGISTIPLNIHVTLFMVRCIDIPLDCGPCIAGQNLYLLNQSLELVQ